MAMTAGSPPTSWTSNLTGMSVQIYNAKSAQDVYLGDNQIEQIVGSETFTETIDNRNARVLANKKEAYAEALAVIAHITASGIVNTILTGTAGGNPITGTGLGGVT